MRSLKERLAAKTVPGSSGCLTWTGTKLPHGYGMIRVKKAGRWGHEYTHRVAWELANGSIPAGLSVLHTCDNPPCVNPDHLFVGTQAANVRDQVRKGRHRVGESVPTAKLTRDAVRRIRARRGERTSVVAAAFGVAPRTIRDIWNGATWVAAP